jgi:hypothetical protein
MICAMKGRARLFERGYQIHEVAQFTRHESWNELKRYTNLRPENIRDLPGARRKGTVVRRATVADNVVQLPLHRGSTSSVRWRA